MDKELHQLFLTNLLFQSCSFIKIFQFNYAIKEFKSNLHIPKAKKIPSFLNLFLSLISTLCCRSAIYPYFMAHGMLFILR